MRALGGLVLLAGGAACAALAHPVAGTARTAALLVLAVALFAAAHPLGEAIGAWPAVLLSAAVAGGAAAALTRRRA